MSDTAFTVIGFSIIFIATTLGAALVFFFKKDISEKTNTLFLAFAAGAMIFVVAEDLIPDAKLMEHPHLGTWASW